MIEPGTTVEGYRVVRMIGRGGMGVVYEAEQTSLGRPVALKVLRPELALDPRFVERFKREGQLQASLEHPHVLDVYEVGESDQGLFLAMRLATGRTLLDLLRDGELGAERALALLEQVTSALDAAHEAKLVHGDVKPQNVLVDEGDQAFLADFGLTRGGMETTAAASRPLLGSVAYVAPEIVRGEEPTPASDRYSFAATVFHCLTGDVVFPRGSDAAVLYAHATEPPPSAHERRPELPEELDAVLAGALAKRPEARPRSARSIASAVRDALGPRAADLGSPQVVDAQARGDAGQALPDLAAPRRKWPLVAAAVALLLAGAGIGLGIALASDDGGGDTAGQVPVAGVPRGAQALGSDLGVPERSVDCRGRSPSPSSPSCSIVQSDLPGRRVLVPGDGVITGWGIRGARGDFALEVIRPRGSDTVRVGRSQFESAGNVGPHYFRTRLAVEAGDRIGVVLSPGASIGFSPGGGGTTQRWMNPLGGAYGLPDLGERSGLDGEIALRADFAARERIPLPPHLTGSAAAGAPDGKVRDRASLRVDVPRRTELEVQLVEAGGKVALDVLRGSRRTLRVFIPALKPEGVPVELKTVDYPGESFGEAGVWWVNPNSGRMLFHFYNLGEGKLEFAG
jgi:predicted Ser/Thr protein kinase